MTLNDLENTMVVKLRNGGLYVVLTDVRIFCDKIVDKVTTIFAADNGYMDISSYAPEPIDDIVQDETIKELDEFGSKEVTFY